MQVPDRRLASSLPVPLRRAAELVPLALAFVLLRAPGLALIALVVSWLMVGLDRDRPTWLRRVVVIASVFWVLAALLVMTPVSSS